MKVAVSATGNNLEAELDPRFGRCQWFVIVDTDQLYQENEIAYSESGPRVFMPC